MRAGLIVGALFGLAAYAGAAQATPIVIYNTLGPTSANTGGVGVRNLGFVESGVQVFTAPADGYLGLVDVQVGGSAAVGMTLSLRPSLGSTASLGSVQFISPAWNPRCGACYPVSSLDLTSQTIRLSAGVSYALHVELTNPVLSTNNYGWGQFAPQNTAVMTYHMAAFPNGFTSFTHREEDAGARVVMNTNAAPLADAGPDLIVMLGDDLTLYGSGTDPENDLLAFAWDLDLDGAFDDAFAPTVPFADGATPDLGVHEYRLQVSDPFGVSRRDSVFVTVVAPPVSVAEPGTLALLGASLLALSAVFRREQRHG